MLQGFTSDPEVLARAVGQQTSHAYSLTAGTQTNAGSGISASSLQSRPDTAQITSNLNSLNQIGGSFNQYARVRLTLEAFDVLARYLANIPGRKNLIWLSGSFPINIFPNQSINEHDSFAGTNAVDALHETSNLLTRSQVAVYPIDVRGVAVSHNFSAQRLGSATSGGFSKNERSFSNQLASGRATMESMASDTGGRAYYNTNGLSKAAAEAVDEGSNYYTITYVPTDTNRHDEFRDIKIALDKEDLQLAYRRGYYADKPIPASIAPSFANQDPSSPPTDPNDSMARKSMIHGVPEPTEILFKVRALPASNVTEDTVVAGTTINAPGFAAAKGPFRRYSLDFAAVPSTISFSTTSDGLRRAVVEVETLVYQPDGTIVTQQINTAQATLNPDQYSALLREGLHFHQEVSVPEKGEFYLRIGVHDLTSNRVGAIELPVASVKHLPLVSDNPIAPGSAK
jgi:VWFA-related protein